MILFLIGFVILAWIFIIVSSNKEHTGCKHEFSLLEPFNGGYFVGDMMFITYQCKHCKTERVVPA